MGTNEVFAISNKPGEVTLKGFNYIKDRFPNDFEVCLIVEKDGHLSAGCWDTGLWSTDHGKIPGSFRQSRGGVLEFDSVLAWLPIEKTEIDIKELWWNPEYRLVSIIYDSIMVFAKDTDNYLTMEYYGGNEGKIIFYMDVQTGNILENDKNRKEEIYYLRDWDDSGQVYEPKTVKSAYLVNCESTFAYLFGIDLFTNEFVWLNVAKNSKSRVAGDTNLSFLTDYFHLTDVMNMYDFFSMMAEKIVEDPMEADVVVTDHEVKCTEEAQIIREYDFEKIQMLMEDAK